MGGSIEIEVKRDIYEIAEDLGVRRNEKVEKGIDHPHDMRARIYASEDEPLYAFSKAFSDSAIMMTPATGSGSVEQFAKLLDHTWESPESGTSLEALASNQEEHLNPLKRTIETLEQNGYTGEVEVEGIYTEDTIEGAVNSVEENGAAVRIPILDGPQGEYAVREGQRTKLLYNSEEKTLEPEITADGNSPKTVEDIENDLERILEDQGLLS